VGDVSSSFSFIGHANVGPLGPTGFPSDLYTAIHLLCNRYTRLGDPNLPYILHHIELK